MLPCSRKPGPGTRRWPLCHLAVSLVVLVFKIYLLRQAQMLLSAHPVFISIHVRLFPILFLVTLTRINQQLSPEARRKTALTARAAAALPDPCCETLSTGKTKKQSNKSEDLGLTEVDYVSPNAKLSRHNALLYIFEDNEAVIQMIIKGRSPTKRHVSRIQRVALGCLFDRINRDPEDPNQRRPHPKQTC